MLISEVYEVTIEGYYGIILPEELVEPFLERGQKRVKVVASFKEKEVTLHAAIQKIKGMYRMMFGKQHQKKLGVFPSDYFQIQFFEDTTKYGVEMPEEFQAVLESDPEAKEGFKQLTDGRKRAIIYHIKRYKASQTKIDKAIAISEKIKMGITDTLALIKSSR